MRELRELLSEWDALEPEMIAARVRQCETHIYWKTFEDSYPFESMTLPREEKLARREERLNAYIKWVEAERDYEIMRTRWGFLHTRICAAIELEKVVAALESEK